VRAKLWTDGGARGNPGPAAYAYVLEGEDGVALAAHGEAIGVATNNVAEYSALIAGLEKAVELDVDELEVISDSELMVKQMRGEYKVKHPGLQPLYVRARLLVMELGDVRFAHVRREKNKEADRLSNLGMDEAERVLKASAPGSSAAG
jgi:ribonuclease HI